MFVNWVMIENPLWLWLGDTGVQRTPAMAG